MPIPNINRTIRNLQRLTHILNVFAKHGFGHFIDRIHLSRYSTRGRRWFGFRRYREPRGVRALSLAERLRMAFEELGATFIKLGQMLSMRSDLLPHEFILELRKLQVDVPPFPSSEVREVIKEELGRPVEEIFAYFEETPFAAASIAQVHRARLSNGKRVVVKVQRPGVDRLIETDLDILFTIARLLERHVAEVSFYEPVSLIEEFARSIRRELDFTSEASSTDLFHRYFENDPRVKIPKVFWDFTTKRVMVLEEIDGIRIDDLEELDRVGADRRKLAANLVDIFFNQIFVNGLFHADPHPGNLLVLEDDVIGMIDFGTVGRIAGDMLKDIKNWFIAILDKDVDLMAKIYLKMGIISEETDITQFKLEVADFLDRYLTRPVERIHLGEIINEIVTSSPRYRMRMPPVLTMLGKTIMLVEGIVRELDPEVDIMEIGRSYIARLMLGQFSPKEWAKGVYSTFSDISEMARTMPFQVNQILSKLNRGTLKVDFEPLGLDRLIYEMDRSSNRLTFGMIIAALIVGSSIMVWSDTGVKIFGYSAIGIVGYLIAGILGFGLLISILRSGRL
ncbi:AarF/ABC1/UbiB kinase family protein [Candidatus Poribacteria bacterium]|nr:AarF/ABC1/UbiB kinase family protein [Candidatus Poribacteria bacterium]